MVILRIIRNLFFVCAVFAIFGHAIISHNHTSNDKIPISQTKTELPELLKILFSISHGEGHLEDFRKVDVKFDLDFHHIVMIEAFELLIDELSNCFFFQEYSSAYRYPVPIYLKVIYSSIPLLRGSPEAC